MSKSYKFMHSYALLSVSDKSGLTELARFLLDQGYTLLSTGGTYQKLKSELPETDQLMSVSDLTEFPEILSGRVKTLHPKIHGGLLGQRDSPEHQAEMQAHSIPAIDILVVNLYPFHQAVKSDLALDQSVELIDIGGVALLRAGAKNFQHVTVLTNPKQYHQFMTNFQEIQSSVTRRQALAIQAFKHTAEYDVQISNHLSQLLPADQSSEQYQLRLYKPLTPLKYGCNPHQTPAGVWQIIQSNSGEHLTQTPFMVRQGNPGYINILDALNAWQLVSEARQLFNIPCAASFKHTSPAGVGLGVPLSSELEWAYEIEMEFQQCSTKALGSLALAYIRARNADPMSSFGDFVALSHQVDVETAKLIKKEVSDGIIAPGYEIEALEILKKKKGGKYLILQANTSYQPKQLDEFREMYGVALSQSSNRATVDFSIFEQPEYSKLNLSKEAKRDLLLANLTLKYAQSNNVALAKDGQIIGLAAGQQSRVDCVKLAGRKASLWYLRQHPMVQNLMSYFKDNLKRQERVNAVIRYLEGDFTNEEYRVWQQLFSSTPSPLSPEQKYHFLQTLDGVAMASDAFFPFRDNIDHAAKFGVKYVMQPGGSTRDAEVQEACNQYGMNMICSGVRMFTH